MRRLGNWLVSAAVAALAAGDALAETVGMRESERATFYVEVSVAGGDREAFLVDTGSSYMTLTNSAMAELERDGRAVYVRDLVGHMADGSRRVVPVYRLDAITIGGNCTVTGVEAAVIPGARRPILGLSALRAAAPFRFSTQPPRLELEGCVATTAGAEAETAR